MRRGRGCARRRRRGPRSATTPRVPTPATLNELPATRSRTASARPPVTSTPCSRNALAPITTASLNAIRTVNGFPVVLERLSHEVRREPASIPGPRPAARHVDDPALRLRLRDVHHAVGPARLRLQQPQQYRLPVSTCSPVMVAAVAVPPCGQSVHAPSGCSRLAQLVAEEEAVSLQSGADAAHHPGDAPPHVEPWSSDARRPGTDAPEAGEELTGLREPVERTTEGIGDQHPRRDHVRSVAHPVHRVVTASRGRQARAAPDTAHGSARRRSEPRAVP